MANYNCTQLGCVQDPTGIYPDLLSCQAACIGWGCPPQLTTNTDIVFIYDSSGSYNPSSGMKDIFTAATAWTATLAQAGWTGTQRHSLSVDSYPTAGYGISGWYRHNIKPYASGGIFRILVGVGGSTILS